MVSIGRKFVAAALCAMCARGAYAASAAPAAPAVTGDVLATVGKYNITEQEVDGKVKGSLASLEIQVYELKRTAAEQMADDYLLQRAAKAAGLSVDAYLKREVDGKVVEPSEADLQKAYNQIDPKFRQPYDQSKPELAAQLKGQQELQLRAELTAKLRGQHDIKILLKPPRFEVGAAAADPALGPSSAPVTIVEFGDYQDPYTQRSEDTLKQIRAKYGDKVRVVFADYPAPSHSLAMDAARAARCAGEQGQFTQFRAALYAPGARFAVSSLKEMAAKLQMDTTKFNNCFDTHQYDAQIQKDVAEGQALGVAGTPAFYVNGRPLFGPQPLPKFDEIIVEELAVGNTREASK
jgi:protein-disulfide isomerase